MGWEFEVEAYVQYVPEKHAGLTSEHGYLFVTVYEGNSRHKARKAAKKAFAEGSGCVRTIWRPL